MEGRFYHVPSGRKAGTIACTASQVTVVVGLWRWTAVSLSVASLYMFARCSSDMIVLILPRVINHVPDKGNFPISRSIVGQDICHCVELTIVDAKTRSMQLEHQSTEIRGGPRSHVFICSLKDLFIYQSAAVWNDVTQQLEELKQRAEELGHRVDEL
ncbi:hypothetical protein Tco_0903183 [Tanacetum coccineum]